MVDVNLAALRVVRLIAHEVPSRPKGISSNLVTHSQVDSPMDTGLRNYFRERILRSLNAAGYKVAFSVEQPSPIHDLLYDYLQGHTAIFISMSQTIADHLYFSQTGANPAGLLCIVEVELEAQAGVVLLKLDKEAAVRIDQRTVDGNLTFDLEHLSNLILTRRTRIFKAGIFFMNTQPNCPAVQGIVSDNQRGYSPSTEVADFFLTKFLGCKLIESPEVSTKQFFNCTENFIATKVNDAELKARYETALLAELNNERMTVSPMSFAETNLRLEDRQTYREWLTENEVGLGTFDKDTELIKPRLRRVSVDFEGGVGVLVPPDAFQDQVAMFSMDDGRTRMEIQDKLKKIRGK